MKRWFAYKSTQSPVSSGVDIDHGCPDYPIFRDNNRVIHFFSIRKKDMDHVRSLTSNWLMNGWGLGSRQDLLDLGVRERLLDISASDPGFVMDSEMYPGDSKFPNGGS